MPQPSRPEFTEIDPDAHLLARLDLGPSSGPRVVVKDAIDIAGFPTRAGSPAFADALPAERHADVVDALLAGGAHIVGRANMHELAFGVTGVNAWTGTPINPHYPTYVPGGSSSGSATAIAAGIAAFSLGTDTGGSIRVPAACCGVTGFKPSFGLLSRRGLTPAESSLDCVGPMAAGMTGIVQAMIMLIPGFSLPELAGTPRIGLVATDARADMTAALVAALRPCAESVRDVELSGLNAAHLAGMVVMNAEMFDAFGHLLDSKPFGVDIEQRLRRAATITPQARVEAEQTRADFTAELDELLHSYDVLILPTMPDGPVPLAAGGDAPAALAMTRLVRPFNLSGHPAIALPLRPVGGVPVSMQLVGRKGGDAALCAIAAFIEQRCPAVLSHPIHAARPGTDS